MLFIIQYCYLDYTTGYRPPFVVHFTKEELLKATYLHRSTRARNISLLSSSCRFIRDLSLVSYLANNVKRADSDGHIISYVLKYFLDGGTYQLPEARRESDSLHPSIFFIKVFIKKIFYKKF